VAMNLCVGQVVRRGEVQLTITTERPISLVSVHSNAGEGCGRSESPPLLSTNCERDQKEILTPSRRISRQVSGIRSGAPTSFFGNSVPQPPLSPVRDLASPASFTGMPTRCRRTPSSLTSFNLPRDESLQGDATSVPTSRSAFDTWGSGQPFRSPAAAEKAMRSNSHTEVFTDRGDVLHRMCNVTLLSGENEQLKVRGQVIGTFWDERDLGPSLENQDEVQVMVTYVDASERNAPLMFPTQFAQTFGDTETTEGNIIKWKASLCRVGKKFS